MTEQFINKSTLKDNYSVMPNNMLNDEGLDADCLAVMVYLLSKPSNWIVKPTNIQNRFNFGKDKSYRVINQLIKKNYIKREEHRVEGQYASFTYYVYDSPFPCLPETAEPETAEPDTANKDTTKYLKLLSKESTNGEQPKTAPQNPLNEWQWYKNWLTEYTSFKDAGDIIGQLLSKAYKAGYKIKAEKEKLVLSVLATAVENKPEGNIRPYLLKVFDNQMTQFNLAKVHDPIRSKWVARAKAYDMGKGNWIFANCPKPDDPEFKHHCPPKYLSLFGVT
jgi:hypothetical protein